MKIQFNALAAAVAFVAAAPASADIASGASGNGELFLSVWDSVNEVGYVRDLNVTQNNFAPTFGAGVNAIGAVQTFAVDAVLQSFLSGRNLLDLRWNVAAAETQGGTRLFTTIANGVTVPDQAGTTLGTAASTTSTFASQVNTFLDDSGTNSAVISPGPGYPGAPGQWGTSIAGQWLNITGSIGDHLRFYAFERTSAFTQTVTETVYANAEGNSLWTLESDGDLHFMAADVHAVPEPSTWALMIAGLLGLGAVARRRTQR